MSSLSQKSFGNCLILDVFSGNRGGFPWNESNPQKAAEKSRRSLARLAYELGLEEGRWCYSQTQIKMSPESEVDDDDDDDDYYYYYYYDDDSNRTTPNLDNQYVLLYTQRIYTHLYFHHVYMSCCRDPLSRIVGAIEKRLNHQPANHEFASIVF